MKDKNKFPLLTLQEQKALRDALHYMKMAELRKASQLLSLSDKGKKAELIKRIELFIQTGAIEKLATIPPQSRAHHYPPQSLGASSLMLYGNYKNDLKTRTFFKKLIGPRFHFTAFGLDWLNDKWLQGKPPTYQEFANYWTEEKERRKNTKPQPKDEWMFIRYMQQMEKSELHAPKDHLIQNWKTLQAQKAQQAYQLLKKAKEILVAQKSLLLE